MVRINSNTALMFFSAFALLGGVYYYVFRPSQYDSYFVSTLATILGILIAFTLDRRWDELVEDRERLMILVDLKSELTIDASLLIGAGNLLLTDMWSSGLNSGKIQSLKGNQRLKLSKLYHDIQGHNYESIRTRDIAENYRAIPPPSVHDQDGIKKLTVGKQWVESTSAGKLIEQRLREQVETLLEDSGFWT